MTVHVPGDKYQVFYSEDNYTVPCDVFDYWSEAKELRNTIFFTRPTVRAAWVMKHNPSQNTTPTKYGATLRRTRHEVMRRVRELA